MQPDGSSAVKLTNTTTDEFLPTWSPDGTWIAFVADSAKQMIMRANVRTAEEVNGVLPELLTAGGDTFPVWMR